MTKRDNRRAVKAAMLDTLAQTCAQWDPNEWYGDEYGLTLDEVARVQTEIQDQLYRWAVRLTPARR